MVDSFLKQQESSTILADKEVNPLFAKKKEAPKVTQKQLLSNLIRRPAGAEIKAQAAGDKHGLDEKWEGGGGSKKARTSEGGGEGGGDQGKGNEEGGGGLAGLLGGYGDSEEDED